MAHLKTSGLKFDNLKNLFSNLQFENKFIIDKIFKTTGNPEKDKLNLPQFLKSAGILKNGTFDQKLQLIMDVRIKY